MSNLAIDLNYINNSNIIKVNLKNSYTKRSKGKKTEVYPFKELNDISLMSNYFLNKRQFRNYAIFITGINVGLRAGDLLSLRIDDVFDLNDFTINDSITLFEEKTGKERTVTLNNKVKESLILYINNITLDYNNPYLFQSRKNKNDEPYIGVGSYNKIISDAAIAIGIKFNVGTHSMRKTWGYHQMRVHNNDMTFLIQLKELFNHRDIKDTLKYIGLDADLKEQCYLDVCLG